MNYIKNNIEYIKEKISIAAKKSGQNASNILLLPATKTVTIDKIKVAIDCGLNDLGENKVQELISKYDKLTEDCNWHLIGHLQTNKVKYIIDKVKMIHSVDSEKLALEINNRAEKCGKIMDILLEVNIADEKSKFGVKPQEVYELIEKIQRLSNIKIKGLMTIAPLIENIENPKNNRKYFELLYKLFVDIKDRKNDNIDMKYLSMGMTNDYEMAIEEGANIVRIGTGIFGQRIYT